MIHVDDIAAGAGAFLSQQDGDDLVRIAYFSQSFKRSQRHCFATQKECSRTGNTAPGTIPMEEAPCACD